MSAAALQEKLSGLGVELKTEGQRLLYDAPRGAMTPELKTEIRKHRAELLAILEAPSDPADPVLVRALADYLKQNPQHIEEPPSWLGLTLWCYELYPGKPTRNEIRQALKVISPELYARNERAVMRRREEAARTAAGSGGLH